MPEGLTQTKTPTFSETWPEIDRNGGRLHFGMVDGFKSESLGLSWVALEDARHRHERDAAQAGLNEAAGRELKRLWGLRAPQTCAIRDQLGCRLARSRVVATGSVRNNSGIRACNGDCSMAGRAPAR